LHNLHNRVGGLQLMIGQLVDQFDLAPLALNYPEDRFKGGPGLFRLLRANGSFALGILH
jgi:hypothetical protein